MAKSDICVCMCAGHVIFEMACGYELTMLMPREQDYGVVRDKRVLDVLQTIFDRDNDGHFTTNIGEVKDRHI